MEGRDVLQTTAEVAIALTGFTGIVVALGGRGGAAFTGFARVRLRILLVGSLAALTFSLLPFLWYHLGFEEQTIWSTCSALALAFLAPVAVSDVRAFRAFKADHENFERRSAIVIAVLAVPLFCGQILNVAFYRSFGPYLAVPLWFVGFSAFSFSRLLFTLLAEEE